jgi:L-lactate dehydrogenase complex protein LldG
VTEVPTTTLWKTFSAKATLLGASVCHVASEEAAAALLSSDAGEAMAKAELAIAETGSLLVYASNADRRAMFLAQRLWLLVQHEHIVPSLDLALDRVADLIHSGQPYVTLMSGPSRTADIERVLTIGVHGPAELTIVIVGE